MSDEDELESMESYEIPKRLSKRMSGTYGSSSVEGGDDQKEAKKLDDKTRETVERLLVQFPLSPATKPISTSTLSSSSSAMKGDKNNNVNDASSTTKNWGFGFFN